VSVGTPLKRLAAIVAGQSPLSSDVGGFEGDGLPFLQGNAEFGREHPTPVQRCDSVSKTAEAGDVLISVRAPVGALNIADRSYGIGRGLAAVRSGPLLDRRYCWWWMHSIVRELRAEATGSTYEAVSADDIAALRVPPVDVRTQGHIADFLDAETARIDALIAKKRRLIARLLERRVTISLACVSGALTSGGERMVAGPLPWLAVHRDTWRTAKLTLVAKLGSGHTPSRDHPEWWTDRSVPWITTGEVAQMRDDRKEYVTETREMISELGLANSSATIHSAGTVVLSRTASAGYSAIMGADMATSQDFVTWTCGPLIEPRFLLLCLRAMRPDLLERLAQGSTHKTIYMPDIATIRVPLPPVEEQRAIVDQTWGRLRPIDDAVDRLQRQIGLLRERRQALITAVVTGKIDVPGRAA